MRDPFIPMQPGIVVMVAAHMMFNVQSQTEVTGFLGTNITLKFTFPADVSIQNNSHFVVHQNSKEQKKVAEYTQGNRGDVFEVHPENNSVLWHIIGVRLNDSGDYWAGLVNKGVIKSNTVWVNVREAATNCIVPPGQGNNSETEDMGEKWETGSGTAQIAAIAVVSTLVLMAAILPFLIWSLLGGKEKTEQPSHQFSNPEVQETPSTVSVSAHSVVYSVLDFPKRASGVTDINFSDADYANVYSEKM
ncbi:hypothetical protein fugu_006034 [Takifugu bimaculatus]|uniref:Immunoglobulin domain-containing protein n=1 Tax=Takifugu bimaculatus TaxID=433685 RepID=A0A4Z2B643_9TELE|nr:hypothetical protein fugu_006034 [Takifugu bimaculatus]